MSDRRAGRPVVLAGFPASEGIAMGKVVRVAWSVPEAPSDTTAGKKARARELERFRTALDCARSRLETLKTETETRLGIVEARIFDPQLAMLDDPEVVQGTERYICENRLTAARAFEWRMLELKERWSRTSHPMVLDRLNDLQDLKLRVLGRLLDLPGPPDLDAAVGAAAVARNLTPSFVARLDPARVVAIATREGSRTSHWAILARSLQIPAAVGLGDVLDKARDGQAVIVDGSAGRVVIEPDADETERFERRRSTIQGWLQIGGSAFQGAGRPEQEDVTLRANLDLPGEADRAKEHGAEGIGLFRTEFLVVGRSAMPREDEQYHAYRTVAESFPSHPVLIRTFDLGGDKFPVFLRTPFEDNPLLGRRGVRVCSDEPDLFLAQLRAILRAAVHGDVRIMLPMVNTAGEIMVVRELLEAAQDHLCRMDIPFGGDVKLGAMIETPAAALDAASLARCVDFFSIGTNDLVQYTLAVDRTNTRLASLYDPLHPTILRLVSMVAQAGHDAGIEVSACGEMAGRPAGAILLAGLGVEVLSVAWTSLLEIGNLIRGHRSESARVAAAALEAGTSSGVRQVLAEALGGTADPRLFPFES